MCRDTTITVLDPEAPPTCSPRGERPVQIRRSGHASRVHSMPNSVSTPQWDERLSQFIDVRQIAYCEFQSVSEVCVDFLIQTHWIPSFGRSVFGGTLIAQSMEAAFKTVNENMELHVRIDRLMAGISRTSNGIYNRENSFAAPMTSSTFTTTLGKFAMGVHTRLAASMPCKDLHWYSWRPCRFRSLSRSNHNFSRPLPRWAAKGPLSS